MSVFVGFLYLWSFQKQKSMTFTAFRGMNAWSAFFMALFVILISILSTMLVASILAIPIFGGGAIMEVFQAANLENPAHIQILKYFQLTQSIGMFVIPPFIIGWLYSDNYQRYLALDGDIKANHLGMAILALLVVTPAISVIGYFNQGMSLPEWASGIESWMRTMEDQAEVTIKKFIDTQSASGLAFNLFMIAVIPALGEELLFRGVIQRIFTQMTKNYHWGIWISAFLFSALHMQFFGFIPRLLLGGLFGYFLVFSGSIWVPIIAHFINNAVGVLALYAARDGKSSLEDVVDPDFSSGIGLYWPIALVSLSATIWLVYQAGVPNEKVSCCRYAGAGLKQVCLQLIRFNFLKLRWAINVCNAVVCCFFAFRVFAEKIEFFFNLIPYLLNEGISFITDGVHLVGCSVRNILKHFLVAVSLEERFEMNFHQSNRRAVNRAASFHAALLFAFDNPLTPFQYVFFEI